MGIFASPVLPPRFRFFYPEYKDHAVTILDIGCGNHSPSITKKWFGKCDYYGVDRGEYNIDKGDIVLMKEFYRIDLEKNPEKLDEIPDEFFDIIIFNHVIEHLTNGMDVLSELVKKLKKGGKIYIEFPSVKSLSLPSVKNFPSFFSGTINFCDDSTHVRLYSLLDVANHLLSREFKILKGGTRRDVGMMIMSPFIIIYCLIRHREFSVSALWGVTGFAQYIYAEKPETD